MKIQLVRHATLWLEYSGKMILVDPMFGDAGVYPPIQGSTNDRSNPLVPLTVPKESLCNPDAIIVTHLHNDHWDPDAVEALPRDLPLFCQPGNEEVLRGQGFTHVAAIDSSITWSDIQIDRTDGAHGTGDIGEKMGKVSGFLLKAADEPSIYIAGDTIFYSKVEETLKEYQPEVVVVNAGGARFAEGDAITMTPDDVVAVCHAAPNAKVVAVHMDAINHCLDTREILHAQLEEKSLTKRVSIPKDGECLSFNV